MKTSFKYWTFWNYIYIFLEVLVLVLVLHEEDEDDDKSIVVGTRLLFLRFLRFTLDGCGQILLLLLLLLSTRVSLK